MASGHFFVIFEAHANGAKDPAALGRVGRLARHTADNFLFVHQHGRSEENLKLVAVLDVLWLRDD